MGVKPLSEEVVVGFAIQYQYTNTVFALGTAHYCTSIFKSSHKRHSKLYSVFQSLYLVQLQQTTLKYLNCSLVQT